MGPSIGLHEYLIVVIVVVVAVVVVVVVVVVLVVVISIYSYAVVRVCSHIISQEPSMPPSFKKR